MTDLVVDTKKLFFAEAIEREMARPKCWSCDYLDGPYLFDNIEDEWDLALPQNFYGFCHRQSAQPVPEDDTCGSYLWPQVDGDGWCSKHKQRSDQASLEVKKDTEEEF